jgi:drug/metabolite transporter superfamily protein YnfA
MADRRSLISPDAGELGVCRTSLSGVRGIYIAASLVWLWLTDGQAPTRTDLAGAALAIVGAVIISGFVARVR